MSLSGCVTNPATGQTSFAIHSWDWERKTALEAGPQFTAEFGGKVPSEAAQAYVDEIGRKLTTSALDQAYAEVPPLEWEYILLDSSVLNAFALPGGKVYVSRGLAEKLNNEAQLAGVIGHEIGHVLARHGNQRITAQTGLNAGVAVLAVAVGFSDEDSEFRKYGQIGVPALAFGGNVVLLKYGREEELEADMLGIQYMVANGYDPAGQRQVMEILGAASGGGARSEWASTHPASETRISRINAMLRGKFAFTQNNPEYGLFQTRYRERMLDPLKKLPAATHPKSESAFRFEDAATWCVHCSSENQVSAR